MKRGFPACGKARWREGTGFSPYIKRSKNETGLQPLRQVSQEPAIYVPVSRSPPAEPHQVRRLPRPLSLAEAHHPQTFLTWGMNDGDLPVGFGGPLRLRVPRQLGYKNVKYIVRLTATDSLKSFGKGLGSEAPEGGYAWYAGI
jgi:DMSO/TMAO reductase YedYZ molybdopterin-dependent catalytic subunit